jgi:hypothetical protein
MPFTENSDCLDYSILMAEVAPALLDGKIATAVEINMRDTALTAPILFQQGGLAKILRWALTGEGGASGALGKLLDILLVVEMS